MQAYALLVEYNGSAFHGWQAQTHKQTVQDQLELALEKIFHTRISVKGASRTDSGVHALGQVARIRLAHAYEPYKLERALNALTPEGIRIRKAIEVGPDFCPMALNCGKIYVYRVCVSLSAPALELGKVWHIINLPDITLMRSAAILLQGTHDFSAFRHTSCDNPNPVKTLSRIAITYKPGKFEQQLEFELEGDGFLKNMVRILVGTLVDVGLGKIPLENLTNSFFEKDRTRLGRTAPSQGLYLKEVLFPFGLFKE